MKKTLIKFLPLMAAVMIATSCSKDDDTNTIASPENAEPAVEAQTKYIPFSLTVSNGRSLKKIAFDGNSDQDIKVSFEKSDEQTLTMNIVSTEDPNLNSTLKLTNYEKGIFSGEINEELLGKTVVATISLGNTIDEVKPVEIDNTAPKGFTKNLVTGIGSEDEEEPDFYSTVSLQDLIGKCPHEFASEDFRLEEGCTIKLTDQTNFYEIIMSPNQRELDYHDGIGRYTVEVNKEGKVWIACGDLFRTNFYFNYSENGGNIYTINRSGFVDLGIHEILWADKNIGAENSYDPGNYYAWGETEIKTDYNWSTYPYCDNGDQFDITQNQVPETFNKYGKYELDVSGVQSIDYEKLDSKDDVAYKTNKKWRMPTIDDYDDLKNECEWVWTDDYNGIAGYLVYKKSFDESHEYSPETDTHIFLPNAGGYIGESLKGIGANEGYIGCYWASDYHYETDPDQGNCLMFGFEQDPEFNPVGSFYYSTGSTYRCLGSPVRAVRDCSEYFQME